MASSINGPFNPPDQSGVILPFDLTIQGVSPATALVEARGENGLLLPATQNPREATAGTVVIQNITSLVGTRGALYVSGSSTLAAARSGSATGGVVIDTAAVNAFANDGFESAFGVQGGSPSQTTWTSPNENSSRSTTYYKSGTASGLTNANGNLEQLISGAEYRSSAGTFTAWIYCTSAVAANSTAYGAYLTVIARDGVAATLGRVDIWVIGRGGYSAGASESISQTGAISATTWTQKSIDVRTSLDAAVGTGNLANISDVRFLLRHYGVATGFYWDDVFF